MNRLIFYIVILSIALLLVGIFSCSPAKQLERAEQRVLANRESLDRVGRVWSDLHPCVPDSVVKYIPGTPIIKQEIVTDTVTKVIKDTVYQTITKTVTNTETKVDVKEISVRDTRQEKLLLGDIEKLKTESTSDKIRIAQLEGEVEKQKGRKNKWFWILLIASAAIIGWTFRKQIASLITKIPLK